MFFQKYGDFLINRVFDFLAFCSIAKLAPMVAYLLGYYFGG